RLEDVAGPIDRDIVVARAIVVAHAGILRVEAPGCAVVTILAPLRIISRDELDAADLREASEEHRPRLESRMAIRAIFALRQIRIRLDVREITDPVRRR